MATYRRRILGIAGCLLVLSPVSALAEEPVETALKNLVAGLDASPDWTATYQGIAYDPATATATLTGLSVKGEHSPTHFDFATISVSGYSETPDGGFAARDVEVDGGTIEAGFVTLSIDGGKLTDLVMPRFEAPATDPAKPFTSLMRVYGEALKASLGHGTIASVSLDEKLNGLNNRITYKNFTIDGMKDGKIASVSAGPLSLQTPSPEGLVDMRVAAIEATGMDLGAMIRVYDPSAYAGGVGDMVWHPVLAKASYRNVEMELPGARVAIDGIAMDDFRMRQPKESFGSFFDTIMLNPQMSESELNQPAIKKQILNMFAAFGIGRFAVSGVNVTASGIDRLQLGDFHINDLSSDGLGEMGIGGLDGLVEGQGAIKVGRFAFGGISFPSIDAILAAMEASDAHMPVDERALMPKLGFVDARGLELVSTDFPRMGMASFRADLGKYVGVVPTSVSVALDGLDVPVSLMDREARENFTRLGLDRIQASYGLKLSWDEATQVLAIPDFHVAVAKLGGVSGSVTLGGLTRPDLLANGNFMGAAPNLSLINAKLTFTDDSVVDKALAMLAAKLKFPPDKIRQQFADALPFLLSITVLTDPTMMKIFRQSGLLGKVTPAIKAFMATPGSSITATFAPVKPVALESIAPMVQTTPETVIDALGFSLSSDGKAVSPPAPAPAPAAPAEDELRKTQPAN
jgi:hypothetical protein